MIANKKTGMNIIQRISIALLFGLFGCTGGDNDKSVSYIEKDREIEKIALKDLNEQAVDLEKYKGKTLFLNFWATWCKPCLEEMPSIKKAQEILKNENIVFLFASDETMEQIEKFKSGHDYNFNYVRAENLAELNIMALPTTFIFNPEGKLVFNEMGYRQWDDQTNIDLILNIVKSK